MIGQFDIRRLVLRLAINILAILVAVSLVPGLELQGAWWGLALVAIIFGIVNTGIRPLLLLLSLPFVIFTLGLFMLFINAAMLYLTSWFANGFGVDLIIDSFWSALLGGLVISVVSGLLSLISGDQRVQVQVVRGRREE